MLATDIDQYVDSCFKIFIIIWSNLRTEQELHSDYFLLLAIHIHQYADIAGNKVIKIKINLNNRTSAHTLTFFVGHRY